MAGYSVANLNLRAVVSVDTGSDIEFNDVVGCSASFALNTIPVASIAVATGRSMRTNRRATIHNHIDRLKVNQKVDIYLTVTNLTTKDVEFTLPESGEIKIFEGRIAGTSWQRTGSGVHLLINLIHWVSALNYASAVSASLHPGSIANFAYPAVSPTRTLNTVVPSALSPAWVPTINDISTEDLSDIWGNIIHKLLTQQALDDPIDSAFGDGDDSNTQQSGPTQQQQSILDALSRMGPNVPGYVPLELADINTNDTLVAEGLRNALLAEQSGSWINTTLWGKIIGDFAPSYKFSVVPRVDNTLIIPFTGGYSGAPWRTITASEYMTGDLNTPLNQILKGVGVAHSAIDDVGLDLNGAAVLFSRSGMAGAYNPSNIREGMLLLKDAPKWLTESASPLSFSKEAEGIEEKPINTELDPEDTGDQNSPDIVSKKERQLHILTAYAKQWYVMEALKGRTGEISGILRFDIAPGSNVIVETISGKNIESTRKAQQSVYATVVNVSYVINAETGTAGTAFSLAHIRTAAENDTEGMSIERPPLYTAPWIGGSLINE